MPGHFAMNWINYSIWVIEWNDFQYNKQTSVLEDNIENVVYFIIL